MAVSRSLCFSGLAFCLFQKSVFRCVLDSFDKLLKNPKQFKRRLKFDRAAPPVKFQPAFSWFWYFRQFVKTLWNTSRSLFFKKIMSPVYERQRANPKVAWEFRGLFQEGPWQRPYPLRGFSQGVLKLRSRALASPGPRPGPEVSVWELLEKNLSKGIGWDLLADFDFSFGP